MWILVHVYFSMNLALALPEQGAMALCVLRW